MKIKDYRVNQDLSLLRGQVMKLNLGENSLILAKLIAVEQRLISDAIGTNSRTFGLIL